ncbi:MAG TPA: DinB family protein [Candidatus Sulfotelmatobacter sp.]|nr:DinB family protein [Candidatus Sulfotelmatobacter sp.]
MSDLDELFRYNAWANATVLAKARESTDPSVHDTLAHLVSVEAVYTLMIRGGSPAPSAGRAAYMARPNGEFVDEAAKLAVRYQQLLSEVDMDAPVTIPWFSFRPTARQAFLQVFTHSAQHRSQLAMQLEALGATVPNFDYITMVGQELTPSAG